MDRIGDQRHVPVLNLPSGDAAVLLGPPVAALLVAGSLELSALALPLVLAALFAGATAVYAAPAHLTADRWLRVLARYYLWRPRLTAQRTAPEENAAATAGGALDPIPVGPEESTQELTGIARALPGSGAVERPDGTLVGYLELDPGNMDFAMSEDWASVQAAAETFVDSELEYPLVLHASTRPFPVEEVVGHLDDYLEATGSGDGRDTHAPTGEDDRAPAADGGVQEGTNGHDTDEQAGRSPASEDRAGGSGDARDPLAAADPFRALVAEYRQRRPAELADTHQTRYHLGVSVARHEVMDRYEHEPTPGERLAGLPVVGALLQPFVASREGLTDADVRERQLETLERRLRTVRTELVAEVDGWTATRLSTLELVVLATAFWTGREREPAEVAPLVREAPAMIRQSREDDLDEGRSGADGSGEDRARGGDPA
jgi:hypothetical protein